MPAGAFGAVRPVGAILPTAFAAGPLRSLLDLHHHSRKTLPTVARTIPAHRLAYLSFV